jgi:hypothetical protein
MGVSESPGLGPVMGPGINYTGPREVLLEFVLVGKPEGKRPLGRPRRRWVDNIRMHLQEVGCGYMDWIGWPRIETGGGRL